MDDRDPRDSNIPKRLYRNYENKRARKSKNRTMVIEPVPYEGRKLKKLTQWDLTSMQVTKISYLAIVEAQKHEYISDLYNISTQLVAKIVSKCKKDPDYLEKLGSKEFNNK